MKNYFERYPSILGAGLFGIGALTIAAMSGVFDAGASQNQHYNRVSVNVTTIDLESAFAVNRTFVGRVEGRREVDAAFELGGKVNSVEVEEGELVEKGQRLAVLDTEILAAKRNELQAIKEKAHSDMSLALLTLQRVREAHDLNATSDQELDSAQKAYAASQAAFNNTVAAMTSLDVQIEKSALYAPFSAVISQRFVDDGQILYQGTPVFHLIEVEQPEVRFSVSNDIVQQLKVGEIHEVSIRDHAVEATIKSILPTRELNTRGVDVIFQLSAPLNGIRRGDLAQINLPISYSFQNARIPISSITEGARGSWTAFVATPAPDGSFTVQPKQISILHQDQSHVHVKGTLSDGDLLITDGIHRLVPGQNVFTLQANTKG